MPFIKLCNKGKVTYTTPSGSESHTKDNKYTYINTCNIALFDVFKNAIHMDLTNGIRVYVYFNSKDDLNAMYQELMR